jgi:hypothetical protein
MFVAKKQRNGSSGKNSCLFASRHPFSELVMCRNEIARKHPKLVFGPKVVDWACSLTKNKEIVPVAKTCALYAPRHPFSEWVTCGNEIVRNDPKHEF